MRSEKPWHVLLLRRRPCPPATRADHYNGKQYLGWKAIRDKCAELDAKYQGQGLASLPPAAAGDRPRERERSPPRSDYRAPDRRYDDRGGRDSYRGGPPPGRYEDRGDRGGYYSGSRGGDRYDDRRRR